MRRRRPSPTCIRALKPGGVLGVVEHRDNPQVPQDPKAKSGYVNQAYAVQADRGRGLSSWWACQKSMPIPRDTKDYPDGVWDAAADATPSADKDRARYTRQSARATASR